MSIIFQNVRRLFLELICAKTALNVRYKDTKLCHFLLIECSWKWGTFCVRKSPLHNPITNKFPLLLENVVSRTLKSFFQLDNLVDTSIYLIEANILHHLKKISSFEIILMYCQSH